MKIVHGMISLILSALLIQGCDVASDNKIPSDLKDRIPPLEALTFEIPGTGGAADSSSDLVHWELDHANRAMGPLALITEYMEEGGLQERDASIIIALEGAPRVVDQLVRYTRDKSRLDVERIGDHSQFFLQYDQGRGFDPDNSVGEGAMLAEGSTIVPAGLGQRSSISRATGLANPDRGYMRFHFNHRPEDRNQTYDGAQLDYHFTEEQDSLHLIFFLREDAVESDAVLGVWLVRKPSGAGLIYISHQEDGKRSYKLLAQHDADGGLAVWDAEGQLMGCYDESGREIGNIDNPIPCDFFLEPFPTPPSDPGIWPGLPGGIPQ